jgi:hypothetical protein
MEEIPNQNLVRLQGDFIAGEGEGVPRVDFFQAEECPAQARALALQMGREELAPTLEELFTHIVFQRIRLAQRTRDQVIDKISHDENALELFKSQALILKLVEEEKIVSDALEAVNDEQSWTITKDTPVLLVIATSTDPLAEDQSLHSRRDLCSFEQHSSRCLDG